MNISLIGFKSCGKSTIGQALAGRLGFDFIDLDQEIEAGFSRQTGLNLKCREIYQEMGQDFFRVLEEESLKNLAGLKRIVLATGGGVCEKLANREFLPTFGLIVYLQVPMPILRQRIMAAGMPAFVKSRGDLWRSYLDRERVYAGLADLTVDNSGSIEITLKDILARIRAKNR